MRQVVGPFTLDGQGTRVVHATADAHGEKMPFREALGRFREDASFRRAFLDTIRTAPFAALRWECPPIDPDSLDRAFEFVLVDAPGLDRAPPEPDVFAHLLEGAVDGVATFPNLGHDAILVAPARLTHDDAYPHLAAFCRQAPEAQQHALLVAVGRAVVERVAAGPPVWVSTAGGGVSWLHVRLDDRPKYYAYQPYRTASPGGRVSHPAGDPGAGG